MKGFGFTKRVVALTLGVVLPLMAASQSHASSTIASTNRGVVRWQLKAVSRIPMYFRASNGRGQFRPLDYLSGSCGDAFIYVYSGGFGEAEFSIGIDSNVMVSFINWNVYWQNDRTGGFNTVSGNATPSDPYHWSKIVYYYTNWGTVHAHFYGNTTNFPGGSCSIGNGLEPQDYGFVSPSNAPAP